MKILTAPQSGSQAGTTASRNRFGQYLRTRAIPVQPRTPKQTFVRSLFTAGSSNWRALNGTNQQLWNDYAAQLSYSDRLGSSYSPTGAELFTGSVVSNGVATPPTVPPSTLPVFLLNVTDMVYTDPSPGPEALNVTISPTSNDNLFSVETSGPISAGITSAAAVRRWSSLPAAATNLKKNLYSMSTAPVDIIAEYKFLFPSPNTGDVIWFRFQEIFYATGGTTGIISRARQTFRLVVP
jgi:hypothetical protein